jgi:hypothetical protein
LGKHAISQQRLEQMRALRDAICAVGVPRAAETVGHPLEEPVDRPIAFNDAMVRALMDGRKTQTRRLVRPSVHMARANLAGRMELYDARGARIPCRYGQPGDRLWVRERWAARSNQFVYSADDATPAHRVAWRASYHMPRRASRITLCIKAVRAEKLCDISQADAIAEGLAGAAHDDPRAWFRQLWDAINTSPGTRWADDPWVWVIEFEVDR